jgi:hypothetical protein
MNIQEKKYYLYNTIVLALLLYFSLFYLRILILDKRYNDFSYIFFIILYNIPLYRKMSKIYIRYNKKNEHTIAECFYSDFVFFIFYFIFILAFSILHLAILL